MTNSKRKRRPNTKGNWKDKKEVDSSVSKEKFNDPSWYVKAPQMLKDVASLSFNNALGAKVTIESENDYIPHSGGSGKQFYVPGIMTLQCVPAMGIARTGADPINIAAKNIYSWVRHQNSGHANYDAPDLMLYLGAMDSVYSAIATLMRVYGTARTFSQVNRYIGDALIRAQGFVPDEIRANLADFRAYINMVITKVSAFCTPNVMTLYRRHFWMFSGVYKDEDVEKSQLYMYRPVSLWRYMETEGKGSLTAVPFMASWNSSAETLTAQSWTLGTVRDYITSMINTLSNSEDINIMSGDILKAYGRENLWVLGLVPEDYAVLPAYSSEVLSQIHNTSFVGNRLTYGNNPTSTTTIQHGMSALDVTQNVNPDEDGRLVFSPQFLKSGHLCYQRLLDLFDNDPTPEEVIVATRNMVMARRFECGPSGSTDIVCEVETCGSDLVLYASIYTIDPAQQVGVGIYSFGMQDASSAPQQNLYRFKGAPIVYIMDANTGVGTPTDFTGDINNYTVIGSEELKRMHESAILSMLGVPFYGLAQA